MKKKKNDKIKKNVNNLQADRAPPGRSISCFLHIRAKKYVREEPQTSSIFLVSRFLRLNREENRINLI